MCEVGTTEPERIQKSKQIKAEINGSRKKEEFRVSK